MPTRPERQAEAARRRAQVLQARMAGVSFEQIGRQLGVTAQRAHQLYQDALSRTIQEPADALRQLELHRLDALQLRLNQALQDQGQVITAALALVRVSESRRKLLGLDAPTKATVDLRLAWEQATPDEQLGLIDHAIAELAREQAKLGPPDPPPVEQLPPAPVADPNPMELAQAVEAALDAAGVPEDRREAAYAAVEAQLRERYP